MNYSLYVSDAVKTAYEAVLGLNIRGLLADVERPSALLEYNPFLERTVELAENFPVHSDMYWGEPDWDYDPIWDTYSKHEKAVSTSVIPRRMNFAFGIALGCVTLKFLTTKTVHNWFRKLITEHLANTRFQSLYEPLRRAFREVEYFSKDADTQHSHGYVAAKRTSATDFISSVIARTGLTKYVFQSNNKDQRNGARGERSYYWSSDMKYDPQFDEVTETDAIMMIDVDYYVDMPRRLAEVPRPYFLYTVTPCTAGKSTTNYAYNFNSDGEIVWTVSGGAVYQHGLWNYSMDTFVATQYVFGVIPYKTTLYDVQQRSFEDDKSVIALMPIATSYGLSALWTWYFGKPLERLSVVKDGFVKMVIRTIQEKLVSVALVGHETSATISSDVFDALRSTKLVSPKAQLSLYQVKAHIANSPEKDLMAPILMHFLNSVDFDVKPMNIIETPTMIQYNFTVPDPSDKPLMVSFANPFIPPAFVPMNNKDSTDQAIRGRVIKVREDVKAVLGEFKMTAHKQRALDFFMNYLVPFDKRHKGEPLDYDAILERQKKPSQVQDCEKAGFFCSIHNAVTSMPKKEAYGKPSDPRNITIFPPSKKIPYAAYLYAVMDYFKTLDCYAFGRTPKEIAMRVAAICSVSKMVVCQDIHRMDGHVNEFCRDIELMFCRYFFPLKYHDDIEMLHAQHFGNKVITSHGTKYDQEFDRGSGEMGTSVFNTLITLFIMFLSYVNDGHDFPMAMKKVMELCTAGGDDGVAGDVTPQSVVKAGRDVGFIVKAPYFNRGETGVNFLSRVFGDLVWQGDPNSMCSLRRQMEKFHLSADVPISAAQKLFEKSCSFLLTDRHTPIIGQLCLKVVELCSGFVNTKTIKRFYDDFPEEDQYPNVFDDWMYDVADQELECDVFDYELWDEQLDAAKKVDDLLNMAPCHLEGREWKTDGFQIEPGRIIISTYSVYGKPKPAIKAKAENVARAITLAKVRFGTVEPNDYKRDGEQTINKLTFRAPVGLGQKQESDSNN